MTHVWGRWHVSSASEAAAVVRALSPSDARELLAIPAPVWGGAAARRLAAALARRGFVLWTWDDAGAVYARPDRPDDDVRYAPWSELARALAPTFFRAAGRNDQTIDPQRPIGPLSPERAAAALVRRGFVLWTWDSEGAAYAAPTAPDDVRYAPWSELLFALAGGFFRDARRFPRTRPGQRPTST